MAGEKLLHLHIDWYPSKSCYSVCRWACFFPGYMKEESWHKGTTKTGGGIVFPGQHPLITLEQI